MNTIEVIDAVVRCIDAFVGWATSLAGAFLIPLLVIAVVVYLAKAESAPARLEQLLRPFGSVKLFGQELVLKESEKVTRSAEEAFIGFRSETEKQYNGLVAAHGIEALHQELVDKHVLPSIGGADKVAEYRSTIHVRDILFAETYYQLLPYLPAGGGAGRTWSIRYGIVGKTWRQDRSTGAADLQTSEDNLVDQWGMTKEEAADAKSSASRPALIAVVLHDSLGRAVGTFFADARSKNAFGATKEAILELAGRIESASSETGLTSALAKLADALPKEPIIPRFERR